MKKLSARWVPRLLAVENERKRVANSMAGISSYKETMLKNKSKQSPNNVM